LPGRLEPVSEVRQTDAAELGQRRRHCLRQVERGHDLGHHAQVRRKRPRVGHGVQHDVRRQFGRWLEPVRLEDFD